MRPWASFLLLVCVGSAVAWAGSQHVNTMPAGINWSRWGLATGKVNCLELDPNAQDGDVVYCAPVDGGQGCLEGSDPCSCNPGSTDVSDVYAVRDHGRWRCDNMAGACFQCSDLLTCCTASIGDACTRTSDCCTGFCFNGVCQSGHCVAQIGQTCTGSGDCCEGFCFNSTCVLDITTTSSTTTTSTSSSSSTSTSTSSSTSTSTLGSTTSSTSTSTSTTTTSTSTSTTTTTIGETASASYFPDIVGAWATGMSADTFYCAVLSPPVSIVNAATLRASVTAGASVLGIGIYANADAGAALASGSIAVSVDGPAVIIVPNFTMVGGIAYRVCVCGGSGGNILAAATYNGPPVAFLANTFSTIVGIAANTCTTGVPPATTGALTPQNNQIPLIAVE